MKPTLLAVAALAAAAAAAAAAPTARVGSPAELRAAFDDPGVDSVLLTQSLALAGDPAWSTADTPARVTAGRALVIRSADAEQPATVNMTGAPAPAIYVEANASLALADSVWVSAKPPRADAPGSVARWPASPDLSLFPGVSLAPGAEFGLTNTTMYVFGGCNAIGTCLQEAQTRSGVARGSQTVVPAGAGVELLLRAGTVECGVPVVQNRTAPGKGKVIGAAHVWGSDNVAVCTESPDTPRLPREPASLPFKRVDAPLESALADAGAAPSGLGSAVGGAPPHPKPWWIALIVAAALLVAAAAVAAALILRRRRHRRAARRRKRASDTETGPTASTSRPDPSSAPSLRRPPDATLFEALTEASSPPSPRAGAAGSVGASAAAAERASSALASTWRALRVGAAGGEPVEVGPFIGRGSYGRVYKGRWHGSLVAVKIIEAGVDRGGHGGGDHHDSGDSAAAAAAAAEARIARESLLSVSLSHPNIVPCHRILFVPVDQRTSLDSAGSVVPDSVAAPPATLVAARTPAPSTAPPPSTAPSSLPAPPPSSGSPETAAASAVAPTSPPRTAADAAAAALGAAPRGDRHLASPFEAAAHRPLEGAGGRATPGLPPLPPAPSLPPPSQPASDGTADAAARPHETWLIMEYADRGSLDAAIRARRFVRPPPAGAPPGTPPSFDLPAALRCLADVAAGLAYLHSAGVVHGDLKPSNVLLKSAPADPRGFVAKLADFGLSRLIDVTVQTHVSTQTYGTVAYQPPEVLATGHLSPAADCYAFGLLATEVLTGDKPYVGLALGSIVYSVIYAHARPDLPPGAPPSYAALVRRCWAADPADRPTMADILADVRAQLRAAIASG